MAVLEEVPLGVLEEEAFIARLATRAGVEEVLKRHGALCRADHPDLAAFRPAHPVSKLLTRRHPIYEEAAFN